MLSETGCLPGFLFYLQNKLMSKWLIFCFGSYQERSRLVLPKSPRVIKIYPQNSKLLRGCSNPSMV